MFALAAVGFCVFDLQVARPVTGYMAIMHGGEGSAEPHFVLTAYKSGKPGTSRLELQWNKRMGSTSLSGLTLWAVDRASGETQSLGELSTLLAQAAMSGEQWRAIKNSAELILTDGASESDAVLFRGPCVQLNSWSKAKSTGKAVCGAGASETWCSAGYLA